MILVVGRPLELPWDFAGDELGTCSYCGRFVRYRIRPVPGVVVCPICAGAEPGDVWILPRATIDARQGAM